MGKYFQKITLVVFIFLISNSIFSQSIKTNAQASFVIKNDGTLWACGSNEYGQLGWKKRLN
ncbi:MAG: RCC1 domain-containing protein [Bacteroidetes bacterium]|nr:RCC1 domain-containing protein [Bacteroidota bacterium]